MFVKYKDKAGKLMHYEYDERNETVLAIIKLDKNEELRVYCKERELKVSNIMENSRTIYEILKENEKN